MVTVLADLEEKEAIPTVVKVEMDVMEIKHCMKEFQ